MDNVDLVAQRLGVTQLRPIQREIIDTLMKGESCLGIFPTGFGKSICFQIPALLSEWTTVVFSPLISLMDDQCAQLKACGIDRVVAMHSRVTSVKAQKMIMEKFQMNEYRLFYVAPERIQNTRRSLLDHLDGAHVSYVVIDEAHCWPKWQEDFRPEYAKIAIFIEKVKPKAVIALTATAGRFTRDQLKQYISIPMTEFTAETVDRPNLEYLSCPRNECFLRNWIHDFDQQATIVFSRAPWTAVYIGSRYHGTIYHGDLDSSERETNQELFMSGKASLMSATNAFGMGINKPDIRLIVHFDIPISLDEYVQETGRAGRDGLPSKCVAFLPNDFHLQEHFINCQNPPYEILELVYRNLEEQNAHLYWRKPKPIESIHHDQVEGALSYLKYFGIIDSQYHSSDSFWVKVLRPYEKAKRGPFAILEAIERIGPQMAAVTEVTNAPRKSILAALRILRKDNYIRYRAPDRSMMYRILAPFSIERRRVEQKTNLAYNNFRIMKEFLELPSNETRHRFIQDYFDCDHGTLLNGKCKHCGFVLYPTGYELAREAMEEYQKKIEWVEAHFR